MSWILYVLLVLAVAGDILLAVVLAKMMHKNDEPQQKIDTADDFVRAVTPVLQSETDLLAEQLRAMQGESARTTTATLRDFSAVLAENQRQNAAASTARLESIDRAGAARQKAANDALLAQLTMMETRLKNLEDSNATRMDSVRGALVQGLNTIRADNNKKLDEIRGTVEEKLQDTLQQRINDSFKTVSAQLEQVYKGLGEMQNLAADVGSLKQVLSGVKTRGILGEVQLGAILEQILAPGQYACNVATVPGSTNRVEYAIKMPGQNGTVWLPIDAKFPGDTYAHLQAAQERGDAAAVAAMRKALNNVLRAEAKDIHDKYIEVPYTTSFGILFLPFEGLYAEVVSSGVTELLQRDYQITVAGPSTMAALLNALKALGGISKDIHLISPIVIEPIQKLKTSHLGSVNPRLHTDEILIALSISAATNPTAELAMAQLKKLRGCEAHSTVILSHVDEDTFRRLGVNLTCEPQYQSKKLYHK